MDITGAKRRTAGSQLCDRQAFASQGQSLPTLLRQAADRIEQGDDAVRVIVDSLSREELYVGILMPLPE